MEGEDPEGTYGSSLSRPSGGASSSKAFFLGIEEMNPGAKPEARDER